MTYENQHPLYTVITTIQRGCCHLLVGKGNKKRAMLY